MTAQEHVGGILEEFNADATGKYMLGVQEHGPGLWKKAALGEMRGEVIDLVMYFYSLANRRFTCPCGCGEMFTIEELEAKQPKEILNEEASDVALCYCPS